MTFEDLPEPIATAIPNYRLTSVLRRRAPSHVAILRKPGSPSLILKIGPNLGPEADRLRWLAGKLPVPELRVFATQGSTDYLLMTKLPGTDASDSAVTRNGEAFIEQFAATLRTIHTTSVGNCPFFASLDDLLNIAEQRVKDRFWQAEDFAPEYLGRSPEALLEDLHRLRPSETSVVLTHGDPSLPNFLFQGGQLSGIIDLGLVSVSDPYRDLAIVANSLTRNMGGKWVRPFFQAYGTDFDERRIAFFKLLDEFVGAPAL